MELLDADPNFEYEFGSKCTKKAVFWTGFRIRIRPDPKSFGPKDPDRILHFSTPNLEISFENVLKSEQIHHSFIHDTSKI